MRASVFAFSCVAVFGAAFSACSETRTPQMFVGEYATFAALPDEAAMVEPAKALTARWQGQRVRWPALATAGLCNGDTCAFNPFPRSTTEAQALGGMFPLYTLDAAAQAALKQHCAGLSACVVDVEGTLSDVVINTEDPLALRFTKVVVHGGRKLEPNENWQRAPITTTKTTLHVPTARPATAPMHIPVATF